MVWHCNLSQYLDHTLNCIEDIPDESQEKNNTMDWWLNWLPVNHVFFTWDIKVEWLKFAGAAFWSKYLSLFFEHGGNTVETQALDNDLFEGVSFLVAANMFLKEGRLYTIQ